MLTQANEKAGGKEEKYKASNKERVQKSCGERMDNSCRSIFPLQSGSDSSSPLALVRSHNQKS